MGATQGLGAEQGASGNLRLIFPGAGHRPTMWTAFELTTSSDVMPCFSHSHRISACTSRHTSVYPALYAAPHPSPLWPRLGCAQHVSGHS